MIIKLNTERLEEVTTLVRNVFNDFVAQYNSPEAVKRFNTNTNALEMEKRILEGKSIVWAWVEDEKIVGMIAGRSDKINLLFVDGQYQRRGIARQLLEAFISHFNPTQIAVSSSVCAVDAYRKLGFVATDTEQVKDGLRYIPMVLTVKE